MYIQIQKRYKRIGKFFDLKLEKSLWLDIYVWIVVEHYGLIEVYVSIVDLKKYIFVQDKK